MLLMLRSLAFFAALLCLLVVACTLVVHESVRLACLIWGVT